MAHVNLVCIPLLPIVGDAVVVLGVLGEVTSNMVSQGSWIKLRNSGREGNLFVGCPSLSKSVQGGLTQRGSVAVGSFFFRLPPTIVVVLESGCEGGVLRVSTGIYIKIPSVWGGRDRE
jgi:hypothetical protein